jgi:hypothetical protein
MPTVEAGHQEAAGGEEHSDGESPVAQGGAAARQEERPASAPPLHPGDYPELWQAYGVAANGVGGHGYMRPLELDRPRLAGPNVTIVAMPKFDRASRTE